MATNRYQNLIQPAMIYGSIMGLIIVVHSVILQTMNATFSTYSQIMAYVLPVALLTYTLYAYRKEYRGGILSYQQGLGMGVLISIVYAIIGTVYLVLLIKFINPDYLELVNRMAEEKLLQRGMDEDAVEQAMEVTNKFRSPGVMAITGFLSIILMGAIYSAIIMIFLKKEPGDPFTSAGS